MTNLLLAVIALAALACVGLLSHATDLLRKLEERSRPRCCGVLVREGQLGFGYVGYKRVYVFGVLVAQIQKTEPW